MHILGQQVCRLFPPTPVSAWPGTAKSINGDAPWQTGFSIGRRVMDSQWLAVEPLAEPMGEAGLCLRLQPLVPARRPLG